jgi:hypothetical protein
MVDAGSLCRHERATHLANLPTVLGYEIILGIPVAEIYEGVIHDIWSDVQLRIHGLLIILRRRRKTKDRDQKIAFLQRLITKSSGHSAVSPNKQ